MTETITLPHAVNDYVAVLMTEPIRATCRTCMGHGELFQRHGKGVDCPQCHGERVAEYNPLTALPCWVDSISITIGPCHRDNSITYYLRPDNSITDQRVRERMRGEGVDVADVFISMGAANKALSARKEQEKDNDD